jgi:hypothetical protein
MADLVSFLSHRRGRYIDRSKFPDAVLNGMALDLFGLYKEVVTRGGFRWVMPGLLHWGPHCNKLVMIMGARHSSRSGSSSDSSSRVETKTRSACCRLL